MKKTYNWELYADADCGNIYRYCHNCGRKVYFKDSKKRRHNANGKDIYEYAIYKCENNHTWNLVLSKFKAFEKTDIIKTIEDDEKLCIYDSLNFEVLISEGVTEVEIVLKEVVGKWRLDKLLSDRICDISRNAICGLISKNMIILDGKTTKTGSQLKKNQTITIFIED